MMYGKIFTLTVVVALSTTALAAPPPLPDKSDLNNEIVPSGGFVTKNGNSVSASWGGFQANAALADDGSASASAGGNGVGAGAAYGTSGLGAGAGVGNGLFASTGVQETGKPLAGAGSQLYHQGGAPANQAGSGNGFFDRIFAIPINVLQSVNTYLNQKQQTGQGPHKVSSGASASAGASAGVGGPALDGADKVPQDYGHQSGDASAKGPHGRPANPMTIPITALRSVQNLLNG